MKIENRRYIIWSKITLRTLVRDVFLFRSIEKHVSTMNFTECNDLVQVKCQSNIQFSVKQK